MERLYALLTNKEERIAAMLDIAREQLALAGQAGEPDVAALGNAIERRSALMREVDALDRELRPAMEALATRVEQDDLCRQKRDAIRASLAEIAQIDAKTQTALQGQLSKYGQKARAQHRTSQGVNAYVGTKNQAGSVYFDQKK